MRFNRMRSMAGNVCLVLFLAFLFSGFWGGISTAQASPSPISVDQDSIAAERNGGNVDLSFNFVVATPGDFQNVWAQIYGNNGNIIGSSLDIYQNSEFVYGQIYTFTYSFAYANAIVDPYMVIGLDSNVLATVYFPDVGAKPPESGGGGGGGTPVTTPDTTETNQGTVFVDSNSGKVTVSLSTTKVEEQLAAQPEAKQVVVEIPKVEGAKSSAVQLPSSLVNSMADKGKELVLKSDKLEFVIPPSALLVEEISQQVAAGKDVAVELEIKEVTAQEAAAVLEKLPEEVRKDKTAIGAIQQFTVRVTADGEEVSGISRFASPLMLALTYGDADLGGISEDKLGVYQLTDNDTIFVGGKVDKANKRVIAYLRHFSNYTIMEYDKTFADLQGHWSQDDVGLMISKYVVQGYPEDNTFRPDNDITRAEFAAMLVRALGIDTSQTAKPVFADVPANAWYAGVVAAAKDAGLVAGYPGNIFAPDKQISRQEMASMVVRALSFAGQQVSAEENEIVRILGQFADAGQIDGWAKASTALAVKAGIVQGRGNSTIAAQGNATRAEAAVMLKRLMVKADYL